MAKKDNLLNFKEKKTKLLNTMEQIWPSVLSVVVVLIIWQFGVTINKVDEYILPSPISTCKAIIQYWGSMPKDIYTTVVEMLLGYGMTVCLAIPLATLISYSKFFERTIYPFMVLMQLIPKVAIAPLFVVWFGFGLMPKISLVFLMSFFPLLIDSTVGLKSVNPRFTFVFKTMSDSQWDFFWKIKLPSALPQIFAGLKTSMAMATAAALVSEFLGSENGLGHLLLQANGMMNTRLLFATIVILSIIGIISFKMIEIIEQIVIPWHVTQRKDIFKNESL
jgi:NitT/TauT family transport system permease protein